ncbi:PPE domain-containing protein [Nocardia cyriacigeorgica]|uniref:PPE domain-containing protein n=1 Tax=Nocardia cyriacigeorgica TaxID=135487 RepID=A0A5R8NL87_9NOCA|nr:hypothetical protein [Nocardia cyriacigeorgica]TLF76435.1 hypothetical protein FEK34_15970 [Nocardia cyriacigeorgica]
MVVPLVAAVVVVGAIAGGAQVGRNYNESQENSDIAEGLRNAGAQKWDPDRQIINSERDRLSKDYEGDWAPANGPKEAFRTWDHKKIYDALNGDGKNPAVAEGEINAGADGWRRLTEGTTNAIEEFRKAVDTAINDKWSGKTANAAMNGTRAYTDAAKKLPNTFQLVANSIDLIQGYLGQAKMSVAPPVEVSGFDEFVGHIPGNGLLKTNKHRANEAEALAEDVMVNVYQPGAVAVDERTPILAKPQSPIDDGDGKPPIVLPPDPPGVRPPGGGVDPGIEEPVEPKPGDDDGTDDPGTDTGTDPESTTPSSAPSTTAASALDSATPKTSLDDPLARTGQPGSSTSGFPGGAFPGGTGGAGGSRGGTGGTGVPGAGRSLPGGGAGQSGGAGGANAAAARAAGMGRGGMPMGMMPPGGARGKGGDDEDEHKTPDYLVQDRTTELLGEQPRVLPPGGVIGA